jgi:FAD/FMN-containing dehydrogenase
MFQEQSTLEKNQGGICALLNKLRSALDPQAVLTGADIADVYTHDWARDFVGKVIAVVRPRMAQEVSLLCALCDAAGIGIIPQGGHTGLVRGAQQDSRPSIVLSTQRMTEIEEIDADNMTCTVQAGVVLETLQSRLADRDLGFGVSIGSQGSAQIGGLVSTNAGGVHVVRRGMMMAHVLGLEVVLADGRIVSSLSGLHKDNRGPDPLRLAIGGEGTLGIITRACLRVLPRQRQSATAWVGCRSMEDALNLLRHIRRTCFEVLAAFEVMSEDCMPLAKLVNTQYTPPFDARCHVLIAFSSSMDLPLADHLQNSLSKALEQGWAKDAVVAQSETQAARFWLIREGLVEGHVKRGYHVRSDVSVRLGRVPKAAARLETMLMDEFTGWIPQTYGHMGDGNLHFNALPPAGMDEVEARATGRAIEERIFEIVTEMQGSFSAEHGIGRSKAQWFKQTLPDRHELLVKIKASLDPQGIMNPGCLLIEEKT